MKAEDVKIGMKVKIVKNPPKGYYGHGEVGQVLIVMEALKYPQYTFIVKGFTKSPNGLNTGGISLQYLEPVLEPFTKADLKTGMRVVYRNGARLVVAGESTFYTPMRRSFFIKSFTDELKRKNVHGLPQYDIMEVYAAPEKCEDFFNLDVRGELLFKREEPPAKTEKQKQAEELMVKAEELKAEFEALVKQATDLAGE